MKDLDINLEEELAAIRLHKAGKKSLITRRLEVPLPPQKIRKKLKLSQASFAVLLGVSTRTLQDWEQGRRQPTGPALALLRIAQRYPEAFLH